MCHYQLTNNLILSDSNNLISSAKKLIKNNQLWFVLLVCVVIGANTLIAGTHDVSAESFYSNYGHGGPAPTATVESQSGSLMGSMSTSVEEDFVTNSTVDKTAIFIESGSALGNTQPFNNAISSRDGIIIYEVQSGDTLSEIAAQFGISLDTIRFANPDVRSTVSPGQELTILPVTGILYTIQEDDNLQSIASKYNIDSELIKKHNSDYQKIIDTPGETLILPYAEPENKWAYIKSRQSDLPKLDDYFVIPAEGWNWERLHYNNGVDIANECGTPIYAAAEGLVVEESRSDYWNQGYGNYILIEHPNPNGSEPIETKYAHTLKNFVSQGDYVLQGDKIALIGNTGNTHGPTGCHLHFEIDGAENPFASN